MFNYIKKIIDSKKNNEREYQIKKIATQRREIDKLNKEINELKEHKKKIKDEVDINVLQESKLIKTTIKLNAKEDPYFKKQNNIKQLCEVLLMIVNEKEKKEIENNNAKLVMDNKLSILMNNFIEKYSPDVLIIPGVIDHILKVINREKEIGEENMFVRPLPSQPYFYSKEEGYDLYLEKISTYFLLLESKGYVVDNNEKKLLQILSEKQYDNFYEKQKDNFYILFQEKTQSLNLQEVIFLFIKIVGDKHIDDLYNLSFLNRYLVDRGFQDKEIDLHELYRKLKRENKYYQALKMEKGLLEQDETLTFNLNKTVTEIEQMNGYEFEHFVVNILESLGFIAKVTKASGDQGVDILAKRNSKTYAIQTKRYSNTVGNKAIQEVVSGKQYYNANKGWVITNSTFTKSAIMLAESTSTILWDGYKLKQMIEVVNVLGKL